MKSRCDELSPIDVSAGRPPTRRRRYEAPRLEALGDVRDVTLGATPGIGDSAPINTQNS
jgi:hypothetical protein